MKIYDAYAAYDIDVLQTNNRSEKTRKNYRCSMRSFIGTHGNIEIEDINHIHVVSWKDSMNRLGYASSYVKSNLTGLRKVLEYIQQHGLVVYDPKKITLPKIKRKDAVWLTKDEIARLLSVITSKRDKAIIALLFSSGARISELLSLNRDSIVDGRAEIIGKGDKPGTLDFDENALSYLSAYLDTRHDNLKPLFISGQRRRITVARVEQTLHEYEDRAGIDKNVTPHVLRKSFATDLHLNGADIYRIKNQLRHANISTTQLYIGTEDKQKQIDYGKFHTLTPLCLTS